MNKAGMGVFIAGSVHVIVLFGAFLGICWTAYGKITHRAVAKHNNLNATDVEIHC